MLSVIFFYTKPSIITYIIAVHQLLVISTLFVKKEETAPVLEKNIGNGTYIRTLFTNHTHAIEQRYKVLCKNIHYNYTIYRKISQPKNP